MWIRSFLDLDLNWAAGRAHGKLGGGVRPESPAESQRHGRAVHSVAN